MEKLISVQNDKEAYRSALTDNDDDDNDGDDDDDDDDDFPVVFRIKREERVERQQDQFKKITNDMDEWRRELTVFRKEVRQQLYQPLFDQLLLPLSVFLAFGIVPLGRV